MKREEILKAIKKLNRTFYGSGKQYSVIEDTEESRNVVLNFSDHVLSSVKNGISVFIISLDDPYTDCDIVEVLEYCECYTGQ